MIDDGLTEPGARETTQRPSRVAELGKLHLPAADHRALRVAGSSRLANREFLFPFAAVVECPQVGNGRAYRAVSRRYRYHERRKLPSGNC